MTAANDDTPLARVRALRAELPGLSLSDIDGRLGEVEQCLQRRLSVEEAAAILGETRGNIYKAVQRGNLPAKYEGARNSPSFTMSDLQLWARRPKRKDRAA